MASSSLITIIQNTVSAVNGLTVALHKWLRIQKMPSLTDFGGVGDGVTDNSAAWNAALASLIGTGGSIYIPPGKYNFSSIPIFNFPAGIFSVSIIGSGKDSTILNWPSGSGGLIFNYAGLQSSLHVRDLSLTTGAANGGSAISIAYSVGSPSSADTASSDISHVTMRGNDGYGQTNYWTAGVSIQNVSNVSFDDVSVIGPSGIAGAGISLAGGSGSNFSVVYNIYNCDFILLNPGILYGNNIQGVTVDQSNFTGGGWGILANPSENNLAQLAVTNSQFNPALAGTGGIGAASAINDVQVSNCTFIPEVNTVGIDLAIASQYSMIGNAIGAASLSGTTGITIAGTVAGAKGIISHNQITSCGTGIALASSASGVLVQGNALTNCTTPISNSSTAATNVIRDNPGYNPVGVTGNTMGASPFTYTAGPSPETHYVRSGGAISSITIGGQTIATAALASDPIVIQLGPNESYVTTWTAPAPAYVRSIH